jgi:hypothetical protein
MDYNISEKDLRATGVQLSKQKHSITRDGSKVDVTYQFMHFDSFYQMANERIAYKGCSGGSWSFGTFPEVQTLQQTIKAMGDGRAPERLFQMFIEAQQKIQPLIDTFSGVATTTKRRRVRRIEGAELDIDRVMVANPECWESRVRGKKKKLVKLAIQYKYIGAAGEDVFITNAVLAAAASDALQRMGYAVEIIGLGWSYNQSRALEFVTTVDIKKPNQPLDIRALLLTGLPSLSRVFMFGAYTALGGNPSIQGTPDISKPIRDTIKFDALIGKTFERSKDGTFAHDPEIEGFIIEAGKLLQKV